MLRSNRINDVGAIQLSTCLGVCRALTHLDLAVNEIEDDGAMDVAAQLLMCPSLQVLGRA